MNPLAEDRLQQYFDGELPEEEALVLRGALEDTSELRAKLEGLTHLRAMMRVAAEERADDVDSDALFARIELAIAAGEGDSDAHADDDPMIPLRLPEAPLLSAPHAELRVMSGGQVARDSHAPEGAATRAPLRAVPGGAPGRVKTKSSKSKSTPKPATPAAAPANLGLWMIGGALAAAAAVLLVMLGGPADVTAPTPEPQVFAAAPPPGSEVEEVDFGYSTGAIFSVEGQEGERYAVIWISDEKVEDDEGREAIQ